MVSVVIPKSVDLTKDIPPKVAPFGFYGDLLTEGIWLPTEGNEGVIVPKPFVVAAKEGEPLRLVDFESEGRVGGYELEGTFPSVGSSTAMMSKETLIMLRDGAIVDLKATDLELDALLRGHVFLKDPSVLVVVKRLIEGTFFYDVFDHFPIIFIFGVSESGKSRLLKCVMFAGYHGRPMVDPTEAAIFRTKEEERCTLCVDEAEQFTNPKHPSYQMIITLLNASYSKYFTVPRYEEVNKKRVRTDFSLYSPLAMSSTESLWGITLSRAIQLVSYRVQKDYPEPHPRTFKAVRDQMYYHRLTQAFAVKQAYDRTNDVPVTARYSELFRPLFVLTRLFGQEGEWEALTQFARNYEDTMRIEAVNLTREEEVVAILLDFVGERTGELEEWRLVKDIVETAKGKGHELHSKSVSNVLTKLGMGKRKKLAKGNAFAYSPAQIRDVAGRLGLIINGVSGVSGVSGEKQEKLVDALMQPGSADSSGFAPLSPLNPPSPLDPPLDTGICAVCGKDGGRARLSGDKGVVYLHQDCEKDWEGKL